MRHLKTLHLILALMMAVSASALNRIPNDPDVKIGVLPNGLTYYIRHNTETAGLADFFLVQRVGSIQECDNQRGLAHFLEHMCFNGSEHFPGNSLIDYLESVGVKFGANLNAYTASDETVYNICQVPVQRVSTQDSCLLVLRDWSHGLLLNDDDIDAERGVIVGEWRQRQDSPSARLLEKTAPVIYDNNIYGLRLPIGDIDIVRNFDYDTLRDFYHKWYNPENQCIVVVGDIDPQRVESQIAALFGDIPMGSYPVERVDVPANSQVIATYQTDPEQPNTTVNIYIKHDGVAADDQCTIAEIKHDLLGQLVTAMLVDRFAQLEPDPSAPFSNLGLGDLNFLLSHSQDALLIRANAKNGNANDCVHAIAQELKRAGLHGFTPTELDRAKLAYRADLDSDFANYSKITNTRFARKYVRHFLDGGTLPSMEAYYKMMKGIISHTTIDDVNAYLRGIITPEDSNVVIYVYSHTGDASLTTDQSLAEAYTSVDTSSLEPYVDDYVDVTLMSQLPSPGEIVSAEYLPQYGAEKLILSNGIKVYLKKTDFMPDRISLTAYSPGGFSQGYDIKDVPDYQLCNDALSVSGCNGLSSAQLKKALVGKNLRCSIGVEKMEEQLSASSSVADFETALQLLYLKATALTPDTAAYDAMIANLRLKFDNRNTNATFAMGDSIHLNVYNRHPLGAKLSVDDLDRADYALIMEIYKDRFGDMGDFSFFIVGNFDQGSIRPLIERYIASLPSNGRVEHPQDIGYRFYQGKDRRIYQRDMEMPQAIVYTFFNGDCPYNIDNVIKASAFGQVLSARLRKDLRETRGWTYGVKSHCSVSAGMNGDDPAHFIMPVYIKVSPGNDMATADIVLDTVDSLTRDGAVSADELSPILQYMDKNYNDNLTDNGYWALVMQLYDKFGIDMHTGYLDTLHSITPADISAFAKTYIAPSSDLQLIMRP